jgi:hypothetical protein
MPLEFSFKELIEEVNAIARMAKRFVTAESQPVLDELARSLSGIQAARTQRVFPWEIRRDRPIRTVRSPGEYEVDGGGQHTVYAEITSIWDILPIPPARRAHPWQKLALVGKASSVIRVFDEDEQGPRELAMWRMEIADDAGPGCYFHVQLRGDRPDPPFPKSMSVPRLPTLPMTPAAALEFVLAELFQERWGPEGLGREDDNLRRWRAIQTKRLDRFFAWQQEEVRRDGALGSPWIRLKRLRPAAGLFI